MHSPEAHARETRARIASFVRTHSAIAARLATVGTLLALVGCAQSNLREIDRGVLYTCGQVPTRVLERYCDDIGVASILNLRGAQPHSAWYRAERAFAAERGISYYDLDLRRRRPPTAHQLQRLCQIFENEANHPVLAHCWGGTDRSGLVAAIYRIRYQGWTNEDALAEMEAHGFGRSAWPQLTEFILNYNADGLPGECLSGRLSAN